MKKHILIVLFLAMALLIFSQNEAKTSVKHSKENSKCFACHGAHTYSFQNDMIERIVTKRMNPYFIIDSVLYYEQNHKSFECIDCHSYDYTEFPHNNDLRMEQMPSCLDCHEGDDATERFNFEEIYEEFHESVHSTKHSEEFTCWMCHNPHSYKINARTNENVLETIVYDNNICLSCHADVDKYQLISDKEKPNVIDSHDWLPNQITHFARVRCIECHAQITDDVLVAHQIQPKSEAVKKCAECHSKNAELLASLYQFRAKENRSKYGFFNAAMLSDGYVIGANRNVYLNILSGVIFGLVVLVIFIHAILRGVSK
ncbi:MAG: hypothetical protein C0595_11130 [Marinilabiliales bacterium]|nr:MAG: hypothetical protein C0595_11130 [Marinilabiliales bacterium]